MKAMSLQNKVVIRIDSDRSSDTRKASGVHVGYSYSSVSSLFSCVKEIPRQLD